jgi:proteasome lid subunit RPN8/RPN11
MNSSIHRIIRAFAGRGSVVRLSARQWQELITELRARGTDHRESGAFLLVGRDAGRPTVERIIYFDDLDPECLTGAISMRSSAFDQLWAICRRDGVRVVADVHTHPGDCVAQSSIDRANPMVAKAGHVAIIVPGFAMHQPMPERCGVHQYQGAHQWSSAYGRDAKQALYVGRWA